MLCSVWLCALVCVAARMSTALTLERTERCIAAAVQITNLNLFWKHISPAVSPVELCMQAVSCHDIVKTYAWWHTMAFNPDILNRTGWTGSEGCCAASSLWHFDQSMSKQTLYWTSVIYVYLCKRHITCHLYVILQGVGMTKDCSGCIFSFFLFKKI